MMEGVLFPFQNCSNFTEKQLTEIALARGIFAGACCVILSGVFVTLMIHAKFDCRRVFGTVVKRLAIGLTASSVIFQLFLALHLVHYFHPQGMEEAAKFCEVDGFLVQYCESIWLLFALSICVLLFFKVLEVTTSWNYVDNIAKKARYCTFTCFREINKLEVALVVLIFTVPLIYEWVPFTTNSYGPIGLWCWIRTLNNDCSMQTAGKWEGMWIEYIPFGIVDLLVLILFIVSLCLLGYAVKNAKLQAVGIAEPVFALALIATGFIFYAIEIIAFYVVIRHQNFGVWMTFAVYDPLIVTFSPLALLAGIHLPLTSIIARACRKRQSQIPEEHDHATLHRSSNVYQPSHTTWDPPHSAYNDSETQPLAIDRQLPDYGSNA